MKPNAHCCNKWRNKKLGSSLRPPNYDWEGVGEGNQIQPQVNKLNLGSESESRNISMTDEVPLSKVLFPVEPPMCEFVTLCEHQIFISLIRRHMVSDPLMMYQ